MVNILGVESADRGPVIDNGFVVEDQGVGLGLDFERDLPELIANVEDLRAYLQVALQGALEASKTDLFAKVDGVLASLKYGGEFGDKFKSMFEAAAQCLLESGSAGLSVDGDKLNVNIESSFDVKRALYLCQKVLPLLAEALKIRSETQRGLTDLRGKIEEERRASEAVYMTSAQYKAVERAQGNLAKLKLREPVKARAVQAVDVAIRDFLNIQLDGGGVEAAAFHLIEALKPYTQDASSLDFSLSQAAIADFFSFTLNLNRRFTSQEERAPISADISAMGGNTGLGYENYPGLGRRGMYGAAGVTAAAMLVLIIAGLQKQKGPGHMAFAAQNTISAGVGSAENSPVEKDEADMRKYDSPIYYFMSEYGVDEMGAMEMVIENVRAGMVEKTSNMRSVPVGLESRFSLPLSRADLDLFERSDSVTSVLTPTMAQVRVLSAEFGVKIVDIANGPEGKEETAYGNITHKMRLRVKVPAPRGGTIEREIEMEVSTSLIYLQSITKGDNSVKGAQ